MRNKKLMEKVNDLGTQNLSTREHSTRVMIQIAIIMKAFGVKRDEINKPVRDYEREIILSDDEIREEFYSELKFLNRAKEKNDIDKIKEFKNEVHYFIDAVRFFNASLADEFETYVN
ncbi:hypothetical protein PQS30_06565 [Bacillus licheniformis]|uniref:hypothetical protein n=1 Tax=Bacillus TaxID=1386 RepID=UPI00038E7589|nr:MULTISPECIES: hypothetical protein [Bacillus]EQM25318.1 hypothetical protein N399_23995 [Bacillus licheniformis CG-B52]MCU9959300.1 hypothetical protein [Bacillus licheniformis]MCY9290942.1 hypothetical protein [Bacillus haynesii]MED1102571.1 hypothetical protein [Bacillus licheniformis]QGI43812.1 hypothetical protein GII88_11900 [Bacillus licheniformis]